MKEMALEELHKEANELSEFLYLAKESETYDEFEWNELDYWDADRRRHKISQEILMQSVLENLKQQIVPWRRGITLVTPQTLKWSEEQIEENDKIEKAMIFSNFSGTDLGRRRKLVCTLNINHIDYDKNNCNPDNLITLCYKCHLKTRDNRKEWVIYFENRKGCKATI